VSRFIYYYAERRYAERRYAERCYAECRVAIVYYRFIISVWTSVLTDLLKLLDKIKTLTGAESGQLVWQFSNPGRSGAA
jgi:hypothetical protein